MTSNYFFVAANFLMTATAFVWINRFKGTVELPLIFFFLNRRVFLVYIVYRTAFGSELQQ